MDVIACPGCGRPMSRVVFHGVHHECGACGGELLGLVPFEDRLAAGVGAAVWRATQEGTVTGRCPFCHGDLRAPDGEDGGRETAGASACGLAACRRCEQVWVPADAVPWMREHATSERSTDEPT